MRRLYPVASADVDPVDAYAYPEGRWLRANMVSSADGAAWVKGLSSGLSSAADRQVFMMLRGLADVVLAGATTVRVEGYGPARPLEAWRHLREHAGLPPAPPIAVVTTRIDLDLTSPLFTEAEPYARTIVFTTEAAPEDRRRAAARHADVVVCGAERVDVRTMIDALSERGHQRILCEGGPRLLGQIAAARLMDELCLTISPLAVGGGASRILDGPAAQTGLRLEHVLEEEGYLLCRYVRIDL